MTSGCMQDTVPPQYGSVNMKSRVYNFKESIFYIYICLWD